MKKRKIGPVRMAIRVVHTVGRQQIGLFALFHLLITPGVHGIQKIIQRCLHL